MAMAAATVGVVVVAGIGMDRPASTAGGLLDSMAATAALSKVAAEAFTAVVAASMVVVGIDRQDSKV